MQVCEGRGGLPGDGGVRADHVSKHRRTMFSEVMPLLLNIKQTGDMLQMDEVYPEQSPGGRKSTER